MSLEYKRSIEGYVVALSEGNHCYSINKKKGVKSMILIFLHVK